MEIIEPFRGRVFDPACGSGGMFVQSLEFIKHHQKQVADIVRRYREEDGAGRYEDIKGLCKSATLDEIRANGYSLTPGRYVGVAEREEEDYDFRERLTEFNNELQGLNKKAKNLEEMIDNNVREILKNG